MELPIGSMRDMATLLNISVFTRQQIQFLASGYTQGQLTQWGHEGVLQEVLGQGSSHEPAIIALAWDINELMGHLVCVIDPGSPHAWILRIVLAPDFIWLGLHFVGTECHVPLRVYYHSLLDAIRQCPLAASAMLQRQLQVDQHWLGLLRALDGHLGNSKGSVTDCPLAWAGYHDPMDISPPLSPTGGSDIGLEAESGADSEADSMDLSPIE